MNTFCKLCLHCCVESASARGRIAVEDGLHFTSSSLFDMKLLLLLTSGDFVAICCAACCFCRIDDSNAIAYTYG